MNARLNAEKRILKRKLNAEEIADRNLSIALKDENVRVLFVRCKELVVEIAKLEVSGKDATKERNEYNEKRLLLAEVLKSMNVDKSTLKPQYTCPKCKDSGYVSGVECECLKREISLELISQSGVNIANMATFTDDFTIFDNPKKVKDLYLKMKEFVDKIGTTVYDNVVIIGDTGVGKTHLMECMTTYAIEKGIGVKYTTAFNFNQEMLKYHCAKLEDKSALIDDYLKCEILFIDDLGSENTIKNVTNEYLYSIINERMQNHRKTIITTNLDFEAIQEAYGDRVFSRLVHKKQSLQINFVGSDLRLKK